MSASKQTDERVRDEMEIRKDRSDRAGELLNSITGPYHAPMEGRRSCSVVRPCVLMYTYSGGCSPAASVPLEATRPSILPTDGNVGWCSLLGKGALRFFFLFVCCLLESANKLTICSGGLLSSQSIFLTHPTSSVTDVRAFKCDMCFFMNQTPFRLSPHPGDPPYCFSKTITSPPLFECGTGGNNRSNVCKKISSFKFFRQLLRAAHALRSRGDLRSVSLAKREKRRKTEPSAGRGASRAPVAVVRQSR